MLCQIQWVDANGNPTPDTNEAVCIAVSTQKYPSGETNVRKFGCCAKHAVELTDLVARGVMRAPHGLGGQSTSQWTREELP